jgi:hypothetical protein
MVGTFEDMLQYADRVEGSAKGVVHTLDITLLRPPPVLTLALVWDSPHVCPPPPLPAVAARNYES